MDPRTILESLYKAGVHAADPRAATAAAVRDLRFNAPPGIVAIGKAALRMSEGALEALGDLGARAPGVVISHDSPSHDASLGQLQHLTGDHPVPQHMAAGQALGLIVRQLSSCRDVLVLLSGGASSLAAAPVDGVDAADLRSLFRDLLRSGKDINVVNSVRRRVMQWSGGRLTRALHPARVHCLIVSDVMGNELSAIGSGPCVTDPTRGLDLRALLGALADHLPPPIQQLLQPGKNAEEVGRDAESVRIVLDNRVAVEGVTKAALDAGFTLAPGQPPIVHGEAAEFGRAFAAHLAHVRTASLGTGHPMICVAGGEATVTLGEESGLGGRCQELALAFAEGASGANFQDGISLLAAGTDGRDGPTDAAGAVVDGRTWDLIRAAAGERDPARDLHSHNTYHALASVGALLHRRSTGTNVNDLVIGLIR